MNRMDEKLKKRLTLAEATKIVESYYNKEKVLSYNDTHMIQHIMLNHGASDIRRIELSQEDKEQLRMIKELKRLSTEMM